MIDAKLLQLMVEASNDGIVVAEQEGNDSILIYANPAFERLTGYSCLLYTSPSPRDATLSRMPSSA